jgi:hypothetical protein
VSDLLGKARQFTDIEDRTLKVWLDGVNAGLNDLAALALDAGLMKEHYRSLLPALRHEWTPEQEAEYRGLVDRADATEAALVSALAALDKAHQDKPPLTGEGQGSGDAGSGKAGY